MSLYQSQAYAHMGYPTPPAYPQQPLPPPNYYPPSPQPVYYADPNHFRRDYAGRLAQLTVNSRPIIQSLSMLAQEYIRFADIVVQCIEQHIRRVSHPVPTVTATTPIPPAMCGTMASAGASSPPSASTCSTCM